MLYTAVSLLSDFILTYLFSSYPPFMALNGRADVPLRNYSLTDPSLVTLLAAGPPVARTAGATQLV